MVTSRVLTYIHLTRDTIAKFVREPEAIRQVERIAQVARNLAQGGDGTIVKAVVWLPPDTLAAYANHVGSAADFFQTTPTGLRGTITDSMTAAVGNFAAVIVGGGVETVPAWFDGTDWRIG